MPRRFLSNKAIHNTALLVMTLGGVFLQAGLTGCSGFIKRSF